MAYVTFRSPHGTVFLHAEDSNAPLPSFPMTHTISPAVPWYPLGVRLFGFLFLISRFIYLRNENCYDSFDAPLNRFVTASALVPILVSLPSKRHLSPLLLSGVSAGGRSRALGNLKLSSRGKCEVFVVTAMDTTWHP